MTDTERLDWLLQQLTLSRDDLDWAIDQNGWYDEHGIFPDRAKPLPEGGGAPPLARDEVRSLLSPDVFPKVPITKAPRDELYRFTKAKS